MKFEVQSLEHRDVKWAERIWNFYWTRGYLQMTQIFLSKHDVDE